MDEQEKQEEIWEGYNETGTPDGAEFALELPPVGAPDTPPADEQRPQYTPTEIQAMDQGWVPADQWTGSPEDHRSAKEYIDRGSLFKKISNQNQEIRHTKEALDKLSGMYAKLANTLKDQKKATLLETKATAFEEGQYDEAVNIDKQIEDLDQEFDVPQTQSGAVEDQLISEDLGEADEHTETPRFQQFKRDNQWYGQNPEMQAVANAVGIAFAENKRSVGEEFTEDEAFRHVEKVITKRYPEYFSGAGNPGSLNPSSPGVPIPENKPRSKFTARDLDEHTLKIAQTFVQSGAVKSVQEYVDQLADVGELR